MPPKTPVTSYKPINNNDDLSRYVNKNQTIEQVKQLKEVFDIFDYDKSGQISISEILDTIKALDIEKDAQQIINIVQAHTDDELDFETFMQIFGSQENNSVATLKELYEIFDYNNTGSFGPDQFQKIALSIGEQIPSAEVDLMIDYADKDRDGGISFEEFTAVMNREFPKV